MVRQLLGGAVVLAAGVGSRLQPAHQGAKWLLPVNGEPIAERQLRSLRLALSPDAPILVVAGHAAADVVAFTADHPGVDVLINPQYDVRNNWYSLSVALQHWRSLRRAGSLLVMNSDLYCPDHWVKEFSAAACESAADCVLAVDMQRQLTGEAMKVGRSGGRVALLAKGGIEQPIGEFLGLSALSGTGLGAVQRALDGMDTRGEDGWYENAFERALLSGATAGVWSVPHPRWVEIDDAADVVTARHLDLTGTSGSAVNAS